jgi:hypothetical protein
MTREFPDELLSAFLDDELSQAERAQVERHLATSEPDRQLLAELKSLRGDLASLPQAVVSPDFADRVVQAAVAEAEKNHGASATIAPAPATASRRHSRRWMVGAAVASAAALAACFLLVLQSWRGGQQPQPQPGGDLVITPPAPVQQVLAIKDQLVNALTASVPNKDETIVLRLRVGKDVQLAAALDAALAKAGISTLAANLPSGAAQWQQAYRSSFEAKYSAGSDTSDLIAAAEAVFIDAPLERLESAFNEVATNIKQPLLLAADTKLALKDSPEGEGGSRQPFAQRLNASLFRLEKKIAATATAAINPQPSPSPLKPQQYIRVLILVEAD